MVDLIEIDSQQLTFVLLGGLMGSSLITKGFISYVPFLPLEKQHVRACIKEDLRLKNVPVTADTVGRVLHELQFTPKEDTVFSKTGCKRVHQKVNYILSKDRSSPFRALSWMTISCCSPVSTIHCL